MIVDQADSALVALSNSGMQRTALRAAADAAVRQWTTLHQRMTVPDDDEKAIIRAAKRGDLDGVRELVRSRARLS